jgi:hypothetical protein
MYNAGVGVKAFFVQDWLWWLKCLATSTFPYIKKCFYLLMGFSVFKK